MPSILIIGTMDFITNETQINSATAIIHVIKQRDLKVYDYLVFGAKTTDTTLDSRLVESIPKTMRNYAIVAGLPIDNALKYEDGLSLFKHKSYVDFPYCVSRTYSLVFR
jgi:hypothetical protein